MLDGTIILERRYSELMEAYELLSLSEENVDGNLEIPTMQAYLGFILCLQVFYIIFVHCWMFTTVHPKYRNFSHLTAARQVT